jgi:hypothetical protein
VPDLWLPAGADPYTTHRAESWRVDLLSTTGATLDTLPGVTDFGVDQSVGATIGGGGSLDVTDLNQGVDWLSARVQPWWIIDGADPIPLGVYLTTAPRETWTATGRSWRVDLLDKTSILDGDAVDGTYSLPAGTVVTAAIRTLITSSDASAVVAVTDSTETLAAGMVWAAGTSKLRIINDLLSAIGYFALRADGSGRYVAAPYVAPAARPVVREFVPGPFAIHRPAFTRDQDLSGVPNKVVLVGQASSDTPALVGIATNTDPTSRFSYPSRGRWITKTETGVEATSQAVITALAARRLAELSTASATQTIKHAAVPLGLNDVVARRWSGGETRASVQKWSITGGRGAVMTTTLREVAA